jgi:hypothetical protein
LFLRRRGECDAFGPQLDIGCRKIIDAQRHADKTADKVQVLFVMGADPFDAETGAVQVVLRPY